MKIKSGAKKFCCVTLCGFLLITAGCFDPPVDSTSGPFSPDSLAGLSAWFKADALTGFTDNDPVSSWPDMSGNGNDAVQLTGGLIPLYRDSLLGGQPSISFDFNDFLVTGNLSLGAFSVFVVFNATIINGMPVSHGDAATGDGHWLFTSADCTLQVSRGGLVSGKSLTPNWGTDGVFRVASHIYDGTHAGNRLHINSIAQTLSNCVSSIDPGTNIVALPLSIGARTTGANTIFGRIPEVIVYDRVLSDAERGDVENYLKTKYAVF